MVQKDRGLTPEEKYEVFRDFEHTCALLEHKHCNCCKMVSMNMTVNKKGLCSRCTKFESPDHFTDKGALPVWYKDGLPQYEVPNVLSDLTTAEKMLIQLVSPFVPLHHIRNGTMGLSGHVCAFEQDVTGFVNKLPRDKMDVAMLKVIKNLKAEIGDSSAAYTKAFRVSKDKVFSALTFLHKHNPLYKDVEIDMSAMNWIEGDDGILEGQSLETDELVTRNDYTPESADIGPAPRQSNDPAKVGDYVSEFGYIDTGGRSTLSDDDRKINEQLQASVAGSPNKAEITMDWPDVSVQPVYEFGDKKVFAMAFPWLFPGGLGDVKDSPLDIGQWGKQMLYYEDGRFARDKLFSFYALNYIIRHRNSSSGRWFVNSFQHNCPDNLEELKCAIEEGNTSFVNNLTYFNQRVKGSNSYWFKKRSELYTWINHHVEVGHGAPMFFITLSCAEYFWSDVIKLIKERMEVAGLDSSECYVGSAKMSCLINEYSVVIQEYFQHRVEVWLNTVGKKLFGIKHHWVRYEFAPGRGQIHAHLLAIPEDQSIYELCHLDLKQHDGRTMRAEHLAQWASEKFGLTASVSEDFNTITVDHHDTPVQLRFTDIEQSEASYQNDIHRLMKFCQTHECSGFCMRESKGEKT